MSICPELYVVPLPLKNLLIGAIVPEVKGQGLVPSSEIDTFQAITCTLHVSELICDIYTANFLLASFIIGE